MNENNKNMIFGISSWSFPWSVGVREGPQPENMLSALGLVKKAAELEVGLLQIADNLPLENLSSSELNELKEIADKNGVKLEVGTKGIDSEHLLKFLKIAEFLESPILRTLPAIFGVKEEASVIERNIIKVLPEFQKAGVTIVLENQEAYKAKEYSEIIRKIDDPHFRICLDLANALGAMEGPYYVFKELGALTGNFHFKDVKVIRSKTLMGFTIVGTASGKGEIPINWVLTNFKELNITPNIIIEMWPEWQGDINSTIEHEKIMVKESVEFMRSLHL
jgi:sugar phosphate isomerase/epimerase